MTKTSIIPTALNLIEGNYLFYLIMEMPNEKAIDGPRAPGAIKNEW